MNELASFAQKTSPDSTNIVNWRNVIAVVRTKRVNDVFGSLFLEEIFNSGMNEKTHHHQTGLEL
jgi:hypothetical protein